MRRVTCDELLDEDRGTPEEIGGNLDDLWRINHWLGGVSTNLTLLEQFFVATGNHAVRILDVGAGDGRLAGRLRAELRRRGYCAEFSVLDRCLSHLQHRHSTGPGLPPIVADVLKLPFEAGSFDVVMCNLFFHHFSGEEADKLLHSLAAVAREAVLINDLERHVLPYLFILGARPFMRGRMSRHDGPASVRQAYTANELATLVADAGYAHVEVRRLMPFRLGLILWKQ